MAGQRRPASRFGRRSRTQGGMWAFTARGQRAGKPVRSAAGDDTVWPPGPQCWPWQESAVRSDSVFSGAQVPSRAPPKLHRRAEFLGPSRRRERREDAIASIELPEHDCEVVGTDEKEGSAASCSRPARGVASTTRKPARLGSRARRGSVRAGTDAPSRWFAIRPAAPRPAQSS